MNIAAKTTLENSSPALLIPTFSEHGKKGYAIKETEPRDFHFTGDHAVYVISKNAANDVMEYYNQQHGMQCAWFRFPPVYGVGPHSSIYVNGKLYKSGIQTFIENAEQGKDIEIWGDPHISRDIIYVKDVAEAFLKAIESRQDLRALQHDLGTELELEDQVKQLLRCSVTPKRRARSSTDPKSPTTLLLFFLT